MRYTDFHSLVDSLVPIVNTILALILGLCVVVFFWGVVRYINSASQGKQQRGRDLMVWGIIAITVLVSLGGIMQLIKATFLP